MQGRLLRVARDCTASSLRRAARAVSSLYDERLRAVGLRGTQFSLLVAVALAGEPPVTMLAERLGLDRTTLTRNLAPLIRDRLIEHAKSDDRRVHRVKLTAKGRRVLEQALPLWDEAQAEIAGALGDKRRDLMEGLGAVVAIAERAGDE